MNEEQLRRMIEAAYQGDDDNLALEHLKGLLNLAPKKTPDPGFAIPYKNPSSPGGVDPKSAQPLQGNYSLKDKRPQVSEQNFRESSNAWADAADAYKKQRGNGLQIFDTTNGDDEMNKFLSDRAKLVQTLEGAAGDNFVKRKDAGYGEHPTFNKEHFTKLKKYLQGE